MAGELEPDDSQVEELLGPQQPPGTASMLGSEDGAGSDGASGESHRSGQARNVKTKCWRVQLQEVAVALVSVLEEVVAVALRRAKARGVSCPAVDAKKVRC